MIQLIQLIQPPTISNRYPQDPARIPKLGASCVSPNPISPQSSTRIPIKFGLRVEKMVWKQSELLIRCHSRRRHGHVCHLGDRNQFLRPGEVRHWRWKIQNAQAFAKSTDSQWRHGDHFDLSALLVLSGHRSLPSERAVHGEVMWSPMAWFLVISSAYQNAIQYTTCQGTNRGKPWIDHHDHPKYPKFLVRLVLSCSERKSMAKTAQLVESGQLMFQRFQR